MDQHPPQQPTEETIFPESDFALQDYNKHIKNARIMLFIIAGLNLIPILTLGNFPEPGKTIVIGIYVFIALVFAGLAFWTTKNPYAALLTAMIFFVALHLFFAILEPMSILQGLIVKVVVIILLVLGIRNAKEAQEIKKTFGGR